MPAPTWPRKRRPPPTHRKIGVGLPRGAEPGREEHREHSLAATQHDLHGHEQEGLRQEALFALGAGIGIRRVHCETRAIAGQLRMVGGIRIAIGPPGSETKSLLPSPCVLEASASLGVRARVPRPTKRKLDTPKPTGVRRSCPRPSAPCQPRLCGSCRCRRSIRP